MPQHTEGLSANQNFSPEEKLFRRIRPDDLNSLGEIIPARIQTTMSFGSTLEGAPSVNRELYSAPADVLHPDCCNGVDRSGWFVYALAVRDLSVNLQSDGRNFILIPHHAPCPTCFAHSVIKSMDDADIEQRYTRLPPSLRERFRIHFALKLRRVAIS